jgi:isocitrate dehydrogenase kinase/phosphatase
MQTRPYLPIVTDDVIEQAFAIALHYISNTRDLEDATVAQEFIASVIVRLLQRGERHPVRLANLSISAYEREFGRAPLIQAAE